MPNHGIEIWLTPSLKAEAERVAAAEGTTLNTLISIAPAEKLSAWKTADYFSERAALGDAARAKEILRKAGKAGPGRFRRGMSWSERVIARRSAGRRVGRGSRIAGTSARTAWSARFGGACSVPW